MGIFFISLYFFISYLGVFCLVFHLHFNISTAAVFKWRKINIVLVYKDCTKFWSGGVSVFLSAVEGSSDGWCQTSNCLRFSLWTVSTQTLNPLRCQQQLQLYKDVFPFPSIWASCKSRMMLRRPEHLLRKFWGERNGRTCTCLRWVRRPVETESGLSDGWQRQVPPGFWCTRSRWTTYIWRRMCTIYTVKSQSQLMIIIKVFVIPRLIETSFLFVNVALYTDSLSTVGTCTPIRVSIHNC